MKVLICHERLLFRFGADRVLLLLARGLRALGHQVILAAGRYDQEVAVSFADRIVRVPEDLGPYLNLNELTEKWLRENWEAVFPAETAPDVAIVGGWPFIASIPFFQQVCRHVIFIDFGVVPTRGYSEGTTITLEKLRRLRKEFLGKSSVVVGISDFIAESQSRLDAGPDIPVQTILLGADHVEMSVWPTAQVDGTSSGRALNAVNQRKSQGARIILALGRWEPGCYKNSAAAFQVVEKLIAAGTTCCLLILEKKEAIDIPGHLTQSVLPLGFPDDAELNQIMRQSDLGISLSLWEGFNLPLGEMQWLGKPALVFNAGAHNQVAAHPWYVCADAEDMAQKAHLLLRGEGLDSTTADDAFHRFRRAFTWERFTNEYAALLRSLDARINILVDVTNSTRDPANSGVIRVTRRLSRELQPLANPLYVVWDINKKRYVLPTRSEYAQLGQFNGPLFLPEMKASKSERERMEVADSLQSQASVATWILLPETMLESEFRHIRHYGQANGFQIAAIFYDAIPVLRPELCNSEMRDNHAAYMTGLAECDLAIPISGFSADCLHSFWQQKRIQSKCRIATNQLPGEFAGADRNRNARGGRSGNRVHILCVSTLEPRKNHRKLIEACLLMERQHPGLDWMLTLIGNRYAGAFEIAEYVEAIAARNPRVRWLGIVGDATLLKHYQESWFTVYPSNIEGFGLPIMESLWHGRPCICHREGVMAELGADGGCLLTDVMDSAALAESIYLLATDVALHQRLTMEATTRPMKTWSDYGQTVVSLLPASGFKSEPVAVRRWKPFSEGSGQMALAGLLAIQKPRCSIYIGSVDGQDLRLLSEFSEMVFSVSTQSEAQPAHFGNVSYLQGDCADILPILFKELDAAGICVGFLLIAAQQSQTLEQMLKFLLCQTPSRELLVVLRGSLDEEFRREMQLAPWDSSPYCHFVDLDFFPGTIFPGTMGEDDRDRMAEPRGGFALASFEVFPRPGPLMVKQLSRHPFGSLDSSLAGTNTQ